MTVAAAPTALPPLTALVDTFQAGLASGQKDARRHRRRGFVIADLPGLSAYASDVAELGIPRAEKARAELAARYVEGYVEGYRAIARW